MIVPAERVVVEREPRELGPGLGLKFGARVEGVNAGPVRRDDLLGRARNGGVVAQSIGSASTGFHAPVPAAGSVDVNA